jgi:hypothetical protein
MNVRLSLLNAATEVNDIVGRYLQGEVQRMLTRQWFGETFRQRDDDIYIATYPKSGTTWMQMLLHQLTTTGEIDFTHIYDVSPFLDDALRLGADLEAFRSPRLLKTHMPYGEIPKGVRGRFIMVMRNCADVAASFFHHRRDYNDPQASFDSVFDNIFRMHGTRNWFHYTREWCRNQYGRPLLIVQYEEMKRDLESVAHRVIEFCGLDVHAREMPRILERSSFAFMKAHQDKFGDQPDHPRNRKVFDNFIRKGTVGDGQNYVSREQAELIEAGLRRIAGVLPRGFAQQLGDLPRCASAPPSARPASIDAERGDASANSDTE